MRDRLKELFKEFRGGAILNLGCGTRPIDIFDESNLVISLEKDSRSHLEELAWKYSSNRFIYGDFKSLPIKEKSIDMIYVGFVPNFKILTSDYVLKDSGYLILDPSYSPSMLLSNNYIICYIFSTVIKILKHWDGTRLSCKR